MANKNRFLITGGSGLLGHALCHLLKNRYEVHAAYFSHPFAIDGCHFHGLDIRNKDAVNAVIEKIQPSVIIHAAAVSAPDAVEKKRDAARDINASGTEHLVKAANRFGSRIVYISTDMVFDGKQGNYAELDLPNPVNFYGTTKLEGEKICLANALDCVIVRITLQYGWGNGIGSSFAEWIVKNLELGMEVPLFTDQFRTPTYVADTAHGIELAALNAKHGSIYHLAAPQRIDRYSFGLILASAFNLPDSLLKKTLMDDVPALARRPRDVSLKGNTFSKDFNFTPRNVTEGLKAMAAERIFVTE